MTDTNEQPDDNREETNAERFKRIANSRLNTAETAIRALAKTADTSRYEYSAEQVATIERVLRKAVDDCVTSFSTGGKTDIKRRL